jgi:hypothetical protein
MKYLKWILKNGSRKVVVIWVVSVVSGLAGFAWLIERWFYYLNNYLTRHLTAVTTADTIIISLVALYVFVPAWVGYYLSDRRLFYDEYMKDPVNQ